MLESLIYSLKEYKRLCELNSVDFNAAIQLYEQVRRAMAGKYATENYFGPVEMTNPEKPVKDITKEEYEEFKERHNTEAGIVQTGYKRLKKK